MASLITGSISRKAAIIGSSPKLISIAKSAMIIGSGRGISTKSSSSEDNSSKIMLMLPQCVDDKVYNFYSLAEKKVTSVAKKIGNKKNKNRMSESNVRVLGSSQGGWLGLCNKGNQDFFLSNPISGSQIQLPSLRTLPIRESNFRFSGACAFRLVLSSSPDEADCRGRAMLIFDQQSQLAFCVPCRSTEWTHIGPWFHNRANQYNYTDILYARRRKRFICLTKYGNVIESWDLVGDTPRMEWSIKISGIEKSPWAARVEQDGSELVGLSEVCWQWESLVFDEQSDQLFLVIRHVMTRMGPDGKYEEEIQVGPERNVNLPACLKTVGFDVYKIDDEAGAGKMKYMDKCLDGLSFFIGDGNGFALSADKYPELEPNCIYINDECHYDKSSDLGGHAFRIYNYRDDTSSTCYYPKNDRTKTVTNQVWFVTPSSSFP